MPTNLELNKAIKELRERVEKLEAVKEEKKEAEKKLEELVKPEPDAPPIPAVYRKIVDEILNPSFGIKIEHQTNGFMFTIVVPDQYSTLSEVEKRLMGADIRTKVISYALGENGVRDYTNLVLSSFSPEMKAKIKA